MDYQRLQVNLLLIALAITAVVWSYWPTFLSVGEKWATDPQYSHGFLVPLFSLYLLWRGRESLSKPDLRPKWWGIGIVAGGLGLRHAAHYFYQPWLDMFSLIVVLAGLAAAAGGRRALVYTAPAILFLMFLVPLPYRVQNALGGTLQSVATQTSTYVLQTVGIPAVSEGNVILLSEERLGVVEACNGLNMLVTFFALSVGVAILAQRSLAERLIIVASAIPIAVIANVVRISLTGVLFELGKAELAKQVFHDFAGWLMMPLALLMLLAVLTVLKRSIVTLPTNTPRYP